MDLIILFTIRLYKLGVTELVLSYKPIKLKLRVLYCRYGNLLCKKRINATCLSMIGHFFYTISLTLLVIKTFVALEPVASLL